MMDYCDEAARVSFARLMVVRRDYVQDERYIAGEHMDVRRDCVKFARPVINTACNQAVRNKSRTLQGAVRSSFIQIQQAGKIRK